MAEDRAKRKEDIDETGAAIAGDESPGTVSPKAQTCEAELMAVDTAEAEPESAEVEAISTDAALRERDVQVADLQNKILYLHADLENFKKRTEKRYREALEFASEPLLRELLPVLDNLERAVSHGRENGPAGFDALLEGLGNVIQQFTDVLRRHGAEPVSAKGEKFDPAVHEALAHVPGDEDGRVRDVYEKGFTLKGRLLRPAKVTVTKVAPLAGDG
jgi:molecular chaperone GrpE